MKTLPNTLTALVASYSSVVGSYRPRYLSLLDHSMTLNIGADFRHVHTLSHFNVGPTLAKLYKQTVLNQCHGENYMHIEHY